MFVLGLNFKQQFCEILWKSEEWWGEGEEGFKTFLLFDLRQYWGDREGCIYCHYLVCFLCD